MAAELLSGTGGHVLTHGTATSTTITVTSLTPQDGDVLVAFIGLQTIVNDGFAWTPPAGWTLQASTFIAGPGVNLSSTRRYAMWTLPLASAASIATSYTWSWNTSSGRFAASIAILRGGSLSTPVQSVGTDVYRANNTVLPLPSITHSSSGLLVAFSSTNNGADVDPVASYPSGMTATFEGGTTTVGVSSTRIHVGQQYRSAGGTTGTKDVTYAAAPAGAVGFMAIFNDGNSFALRANGIVSSTNFTGTITDFGKLPAEANDAQFGTGTAPGSFTVRCDLEATPSDFVSMSSLSVVVRMSAYDFLSGDSATVTARVFQSNLSTPLTDQVTVDTLTDADASFSNYTVAFTGVVASNKATWDDAVLVLTYTPV
jgi:hypothetical protein